MGRVTSRPFRARDFMDTHLLDNPIWNALGSGDARFCVSQGAFRRYEPEVAAFVAAEAPEGLSGLAEVLPVGGGAAVITAEAIPTPTGVELVVSRPLYHMIALKPRLKPVTAAIQPLTAEHVEQMLALVELTRPGPFFRRTIEFGGYVGIFDGERLVAMAGER